MPTLPAPYPDLLAAAAAWFNGNPTLQALFPGGLLTSRGAAGQVYPYARVQYRKPQPGLSPDDEQYLLTLSAYALDEDEAADAAQQLAASYLDESRDPLTFTDKRGLAWRESRRLEQDGQGPDLADMIAGIDGQEGGYVWRYRVPIEVWVVPA